MKANKTKLWFSNLLQHPARKRIKTTQQLLETT